MRLQQGVEQGVCQLANSQRGWGFAWHGGQFVSQELQFL